LGGHVWLLDCYLNDVICIPFWLPMMLWAEKKCGMRPTDAPPTRLEIVIALVIWSAMFEVIIPYHKEWKIPTVADPFDVLAYSAGALGSALIWNWYYCRKPSGEC
jgi:hypothetical protein